MLFQNILHKVISGGQTGVDQAALVAASQCDLETGGTMPKGFLTLDGPDPEFAKLFCLKEHVSSSYTWRTGLNVRHADATIRIASNFYSPGERCTLRYLKAYMRPYLDIDIDEPLEPDKVAKWIADHDVKILNVAGNSERSSPGIHETTISYLRYIFRLLKTNNS